MAEYIATSITGFGSVVERLLKQDLEDLKVLSLSDGLIHFRYSGDPRKLRQLPYLNNVFFVMKSFHQGESMEQMASSLDKRALGPLIRKGTFRVRFSDAGQFVAVPKNTTRQVEDQVMARSALQLDRLHPQTEIWLIRRRDGSGFYAQLLWKRRVTEKDLPQGMLRPELAYLLCRIMDLPPDAVVCDPFAGYGSLPAQLRTMVQTVLVSDLDPERAKEAGGICADARHLHYIQDHTVDAVITDPPWGLYEAMPDLEAFYQDVLKEFKRILKPEGQVLILTARKEECKKAAEAAGFQIQSEIHTLVNGKKAAVYIFKPL